MTCRQETNVGNRCQGTAFVLFVFFLFSPSGQKTSTFSQSCVCSSESIEERLCLESGSFLQLKFCKWFRGRPDGFLQQGGPLHNLKIKEGHPITTCRMPSVKLNRGFPLSFNLLFPSFCFIRIMEAPMLMCLCSILCLQLISTDTTQRCTKSEGDSF